MNAFVDSYFSVIQDNFGKAYEIAAQNNFDRQKYLPVLGKVYNHELIQTTTETVFQELQSLDWSSQEELVKNANGLKINYLGGEYIYKKKPSEISNFLKRTALYADTIVIEEQLFGHLLHTHDLKLSLDYFGYILEFAINYLNIEDFFHSNSDLPICVFAPSLNFNPERRNIEGKNWRYMKEATTAYASELFGINFGSFSELESFLLSKGSDREFLQSVAKGKKLVTQDGAKIDEFLIQQYRQAYWRKNYRIPNEKIYETLLMLNCDRVFDLEYSGKLGTIPITEYRATWDSIVWLMQFDNNNIVRKVKRKVLSKDALIIKALNENQRTLGNIPLEGLKKLRENGEMADLRDLIGRNIKEVENASDEEFAVVGRNVSYNIEIALRKHSSDVQSLNEKYKRFFGYTLAGTTTYVVSSCIGFVASAYQPLALATGILGGIPLGIQTVKQYLDLRDKHKELQTKPVSILFESKNNREA